MVMVVVVVVFTPKFCYLSVGICGVMFRKLQSEQFYQFSLHIFRVQYIWIHFLPTPGHSGNSWLQEL
jgi:hypothetical protein